MRTVTVGKLIIGGHNPVSIQTMWKDPLIEITPEIITRLEMMHRMGCDLIRFAVPDIQAAEVLGTLAEKVTIPIVADIHFDYKIALRCLDFPIDKIRINPGNIGSENKVREILEKARDKNTAFRIGVNGGSLPRLLRKEQDKALAMVKAAEKELEIFEKLNYKNYLISLKSSDVDDTIRANEIFASKYDIPLHLGVTEAGPLIPGIVKSTIAMYKLLNQGIGSTIRVSLSDDPEKEIITAKELLTAMGLKKTGVKIVSCPRCGRAGFDVHSFVKKVEEFAYLMKKNVTIAVMGCVVNGPEEAKSADIGITGSGNQVVIFRDGEIVKKTDINNALEDFKQELEKL